MSDVPDICANCDHAYEASQDPGALVRAAPLGVPALPLLCRRYPQPVVVRSAHSCGDHSALVERRRFEDAELMALVLQRIFRLPEPEEIEPEAAEEMRQ